MNQSNTLRILIVAFVATLAGAYLLSLAQERTRPQPQITPTTPPRLLFPEVDPTQITWIELEARTVAQKITLTRQPGEWQARDEKGASLNVDIAQVTRMLQVLPSLRYNRSPEGSDVRAFGLADGGLFIIRFDAGRRYTLRIGDLNSDQTIAFVQRDDDPAVLQIPGKDAVILLLMLSEKVQ